jgi:hypothetical protein
MKGKYHLRGELFAIATMHKKEQVIAPLFASEFGAIAMVPENINTDALGTFSGEIPRVGDMHTAAQKKCLMAMDLLNLDFGVASEGSFGPHPECGYIPAATECIVFIDRKSGLEIHETIMSIETNFLAQHIATESELREFATHVGFPSHGLILRNSDGASDGLFKGLQEEDKLMGAFHSLQKEYGSVFVETDMRAMYNPTRMKMIAKCAQKLIDKINSNCPECATPGFGVGDVICGLPCKLCGLPTRSVLAHLYICNICGCRTEKMYPLDKLDEDPMFCDYCNP